MANKANKLREKDILEDEYNAAPYQSFPFSHTQPAHLFTLGKLFGLNPKAFNKARVLELGCASGGNIMPLAYQYPEAEFLGIDLADKQVDDGIQKILDLNLKNITLRHQSILDFGAKDGKFDYIICHGVYSWVDDEVRNKILQICDENLAKNGIAYVSYNTFPGWNMVNSVRDLMYWHTKNIQDPQTKAQQARSVLKFVTDGLQADKSPYAEVLRNEINLLSRQADYYLLHEHLSYYNTPVYFYQFMESANKHHLSYLSDAFLATMFTDNLPPQFAKELNKITNIIIAGQYMDFIRNQRFRCTLLCHNDQQVNRSLKTSDIENFYLQFVGKANIPDFSEKDIGQGKEVGFTNGSVTLTVRNPVSQLAMLILIEEQQKPIHYNELCEKLMQRSSVKQIGAIKHNLNEELNLMRAVFGGLIHLSSHPGNYTTSVAEKPIACPFARYQASSSNYVTNRRHQNVMLDPLSKVLLPALDGKHNLASLYELVHKNIDEGKLFVLDKDKNPIKNNQEVAEQIQVVCQNTLKNFAKNALLVEK